MNDAGQLRLFNDSKQIGTNRWQWSVWLDGPADVLDRVRRVTYYLHPTFEKPIVSRDDRSDKFRLRSNGWGEFQIRAEVDLGAEDNPSLIHWLRFDRDEAGGQATRIQATVYVTHTASDGPVASSLCDRLLDNGVKPVAVPYSTGTDLTAAVTDNIRKADIIMILTSGEVSDWGRREAQHALEICRVRDKPLIPVMVGDAPAPDSLRGFQVHRVRNADDLERLVQSIVLTADGLTEH